MAAGQSAAATGTSTKPAPDYLFPGHIDQSSACEQRDPEHPTNFPTDEQPSPASKYFGRKNRSKWTDSGDLRRQPVERTPIGIAKSD